MSYRIFFLLIIILSCNSDKNKRPKNVGKPKLYWNSLGLIYGPVSKIIQTSKVDNSEVTTTYEFSDQSRKIIKSLHGKVDAELYLDNDMLVDSLIHFTSTRNITTVYFKLKLFENYISHSIDMGRNKDSTMLEIDSSRRLVKSYFKGNLYSIDSFNASGFLVKKESVMANATHTFNYDKYGHVKSELVKFLYRPDDFNKSFYHYEYDEYGNWIERVAESHPHDVANSFTIKTKRTIVYK